MVLMAEGRVEGLVPNSSKYSLCTAVDWLLIPQSTVFPCGTVRVSQSLFLLSERDYVSLLKPSILFLSPSLLMA